MLATFADIFMLTANQDLKIILQNSFSQKSERSNWQKRDQSSFSIIFRLFKKTLLQFLQQINVKNVHPVYGAGIWTHNLLNLSRLS